MEHTSEQYQTKSPFSKKLIVFGSIGFIIFVGLVVLTLSFVHQVQLTNNVKTALSTASNAMERAGSGNGFSIGLPNDVSNDKKVQLEGGGSFDGTAYCISGKSVDEPSIVYYIDSSSKTAHKGTCQSAANLPKPVIVANLQNNIASATQIGLIWTPAIYGASYTLQCATNQVFSENLVNSTDSSLARACNNLKDGTIYFVRVRANNASGAGPWSSVITVTTNTLSSAPTDLTVVATSATNIHYSWHLIGGAQKYILEWSTDINFMQNLKTITTTNTSGTLSGLSLNTRYFFHVKAITANFDLTHATFSPEVYVSTPEK